MYSLPSITAIVPESFGNVEHDAQVSHPYVRRSSWARMRFKKKIYRRGRKVHTYRKWQGSAWSYPRGAKIPV